ncbi:MAG: aminopeptidase [Lentisphaerae bacterium GWF2_50_93]|nr:MAG: aminopeptidase [Lentisphaerae bacterium GWF2_50_93]
MKVKIITKWSAIRLGIFISVLMLTGVIGGCMMISMPGNSYAGPPVPFSDEEMRMSAALKSDVEYIAGTIGPRNFLNYGNLVLCADFIEKSFKDAGYGPSRMDYVAEESLISSWRGAPKNDSLIYSNIEVELKGTKYPDEIIIVGAHYDSPPVDGCRAANDNGSGIAATLELAKAFAGKQQERTLRFVAFANEEPPYFWTPGMGSLVYAKSCKEKKENIVGMFSLETIGYYSDDEGSQNYPYPMNYFYPSSGNFIAFVSDISSRSLLKKSVRAFRENTKFPSEGAALPGLVPGVGWSDHWSFWQMGYPGVMVTDTATFRYPYYHTSKDDPERLDYDKMARVVKGMELVLKDLANDK